MVNGYRRRRRRRKLIAGVLITAGVSLGAVIGIVVYKKQSRGQQEQQMVNEISEEEQKEQKTKQEPDQLLAYYMEAVNQGDYEKMYELLSQQSKREITKEAFVERNKKIYEGIEMKDMKIQIEDVQKQDDTLTVIQYESSFDTAAGKMEFDNKARFVYEEDHYALLWTDACIFPELWGSDKVRIVRPEASRGRILDRNEVVLAGPGEASVAGIVPGKLKDQENAIKQIAKILDMSEEKITKLLSAKWVKEDSFVPLKTMPKIDAADPQTSMSEETILEEQSRQAALLQIDGVMIGTQKVRQYPLGKAASHLIGYVQSVTAEDLEKHAGEGYTSNSKIGKVGLEALYEKELKGQNGCEIYLENEKGEKKQVLASVPKKNGEDIVLTIDARIQKKMYQKFCEDKSCSVAMNPKTGEILALVSTPSYDDNDFIYGISSAKWEELNESEEKPMLNRYRQLWCPGSTFKPIIGSIALKEEVISPAEEFEYEGLSWRKDAGWGGYAITTLHDYKPVILKNALIYSDNIYFAKTALRIGASRLAEDLKGLGFSQEIPFEISLRKSQFSNQDEIKSEIQLADSGYGQGQILVNPIHLSAIYSMFSNQGNMIKPYLLYQQDAKPEVWIEHVVTENIAQEISDDLKDVVNQEHGTGYAAHREDVELRGKTGTAEIKGSKGDQKGTELGWFAVYTADPAREEPLQIVTMVEDVKNRGGSVYVVKKIDELLDDCLNLN